MTLSIDSTRAPRLPSELEDLVRVVLLADPADEVDWIEWKSKRSLTTAEGRGDVARHILGFANRHPDRAARVVEGCGYLLVGVEPGKLIGTDRIDPAELEAGLRPYLGDPGPRVSFHNVRPQGQHVVVFVVEPARWGDPIYCLEREFPKYQAGTVFVRRMGSTRFASPADMKYLQDRLLRRGYRIQVEVDWRETPAQVTPLEIGPAAVDEWIRGERAALLAPLEQIEKQKNNPDPRPRVNSFNRRAGDGLALRELEDLERRQAAGEALTAEEQASLAAGKAQIATAVNGFADAVRTMVFRSGRQENRSQKAYRQEVEAYLTAAREAIPDVAVSGAIAGGLLRLRPVVSNPTDRNHPSVQVGLSVAGPVMARNDESEATPLPRRPRPFGTLRPEPRAGFIPRGFGAYIPGASLGHGIPQVIIDNSASARLRFRPVDLRPQQARKLAPFHLIVRPELAGQSLPVNWTATSGGVDGIASGSLTVEVRSIPAMLGELVTRLPDE